MPSYFSYLQRRNSKVNASTVSIRFLDVFAFLMAESDNLYQTYNTDFVLTDFCPYPKEKYTITYRSA